MNFDIDKTEPNILLSIINMKLRDFYSSLDDLCEDMDISKSELLEHLEKNGFIYNENTNQFAQK